MNPDESDISGLNQLLLDSTLAGIDEEASASQMEAVLRSLAGAIADADSIRRAVVREALIRRLRRAGVSCPVTLADVVCGPERPTVSATPTPAVPWDESVHGPALLDDIAGTLRRFVVLPAAASDAQALWCLNTYAHEASGVSPILSIRSAEKRCGKTRNLEVLGCLVHRPILTANITVAALYRTIDHYRPTLLLDEADTIFVNGSNTELRGILNAGLYRSNAFVLRCIGKHQEPKLSSVWCPKAIALIGRLPATLEDRSIVTSLERRRDEAVEPFRYDHVLEEMESIRRKAARWAADHLLHLKSAIPEVANTLHDRARDLWRPLQAIADAVGGDWPERARQAARELSDDTPDPELRAIPHDARSVFLNHQPQRETTFMKTAKTIITAPEAPKTRTPGRAPATETTTAATTIASKVMTAKKRGAKAETASAHNQNAAPHSAGPDEARAADTKKAIVLELLRRKQGVTTSEIGKATGWQNHTIRGFISGNVTKKMGLKVESSKNSAGARVYRMVR